MFTTKHVNRHYAMDMRKALSTQCAAVGEHICSDRSAWLKENTGRWVGNSVQKKAAFRGHGLGAFANSTFCSQPAGDSPIRLSVIDALRAIPESEIRSMREVLAANYYKMIVDPSLVEVRALHSVVPVLSSGGSGSAGSPRSVGGRCSLPPHVSEIFARAAV